jgi:hypothetical protein
MPKEVKEDSKKKVLVVEEVTPEEEKVETPKKEEVEQVPEKAETKIEEALSIPDLEEEEQQEKTNYLWIIIPVALLIGALVGGLITYFSGISKIGTVEPTPTAEATVEPTVTSEPTASPSSTLKRDTVKLQILNGSGVSGLAGKAKTYLEGLGYKDVQTGNASKSDLTETIVSAKKDAKKELLDAVIADLSKNYKVADETEVLQATSKYDFVITLGSK